MADTQAGSSQGSGAVVLRNVFLLAVLVGFIGLGLIDLAHGNYRTGSASIFLAAANYLLLVL